MYSYGPPHMAVQKQDDQLEHTYSNYVRTQDVALKTCRRRWMIGRSGERGSGIPVLAAHDHDHDDYLNHLSFPHPRSMIVFQWCLSFQDSFLYSVRSQQCCSLVPTRFLIYKSLSPCTNPLVTVIIILFIWEFSTPPLVDGFPLEFEWESFLGSLGLFLLF